MSIHQPCASYRSPYLQILLVWDSDRLVLLALARHCLSRPQTWQCLAGSGRSYKNCGFRHVQGRHYRWQDHQDLLWHAWLHSAWGKCSNRIFYEQDITEYWRWWIYTVIFSRNCKSIFSWEIWKRNIFSYNFFNFNLPEPWNFLLKYNQL